jgi:hypothetical protein
MSSVVESRQRKILMSESLRKALDDLDAEQLEDSGFEGEEPEPEYDEREHSEVKCSLAEDSASHIFDERK